LICNSKAEGEIMPTRRITPSPVFTILALDEDCGPWLEVRSHRQQVGRAFHAAAEQVGGKMIKESVASKLAKNNRDPNECALYEIPAGLEGQVIDLTLRAARQLVQRGPRG
jgi:hypothetical protein